MKSEHAKTARRAFDMVASYSNIAPVVADQLWKTAFTAGEISKEMAILEEARLEEARRVIELAREQGQVQ